MMSAVLAVPALRLTAGISTIFETANPAYDPAERLPGRGVASCAPRTSWCSQARFPLPGVGTESNAGQQSAACLRLGGAVTTWRQASTGPRASRTAALGGRQGGCSTGRSADRCGATGLQKAMQQRTDRTGPGSGASVSAAFISIS